MHFAVQNNAVRSIEVQCSVLLMCALPDRDYAVGRYKALSEPHVLLVYNSINCSKSSVNFELFTYNSGHCTIHNI